MEWDVASQYPASSSPTVAWRVAASPLQVHANGMQYLPCEILQGLAEDGSGIEAMRRLQYVQKPITYPP